MGKKQQRRTDISGMKFGMLTAIEKIGYDTDKDGKRFALWKCKCDCGGEGIFNQHRLVSNSVKSCGCLRNRDHYTAVQHGLSRTRIYKIYNNMKIRCDNPNDQHYPNYGGRGITVCSYWRGIMGFTHFYEWAMKNGYRDDLTIDRIDVNGNYEPDNCKWATTQEQQENKRTNVRYEVNGELLLMKEIVEKYNISQSTLYDRTKKLGLTMQEAVYYKRKTKRNQLITCNGETHDIETWSKITGITVGTILYRLKHGYSVNNLFIKDGRSLRGKEK